MLFLGTPFCGSSAANWGDRIRAIFNFVNDTNKYSLSDSKRQPETLQTLDEAFPAVLRKRDRSKNTEDRIEAVFFYETLNIWDICKPRYIHRLDLNYGFFFFS
jgi:hypothetical protein